MAVIVLPFTPLPPQAARPVTVVTHPVAGGVATDL